MKKLTLLGLLLIAIVSQLSAQTFKFEQSAENGDVYYWNKYRGEGGRAIAHGDNNTLTLNYLYDFKGGLNIDPIASFKENKIVIKGPNQPLGIGSSRDISYEFAAAGKAIIRSYRGGSWDTYLQFLTMDYNKADPVVRMHINGNGNIGIGTEAPKSKLEVNGTIRAKEVKIEATGWPDYVFAKDYQLPSLTDVENHIIAHKHLPNIPSEAEVKENGIDIGDMQAKLLQKVEELTLYLIEQDKKIKALEKENIEIKEQLNKGEE